MKITSDWHIHTQNSCDGACATIADIITDAAALGIRDFGITDHLHTMYNYPDLVASRTEFDACHPGPNIHFGIEASSVSAWELAQLPKIKAEKMTYGMRAGGPANAKPAVGFDAELLEELNIEYVVAGTHWPLYVPFERDAIIRSYHEQNMFLAQHQLVTIVAHPWWWMGHWQGENDTYHGKPWFDDFGKIPQSMHDEFGAAAVENNTAVEINLSAILLNRRYPAGFAERYLDYMVGLKEQGVTFSIGSDLHLARLTQIDYTTCENLLEKAGFRDEDFFRLPPRK
jgi:histidinol phosphatase-like PHP family hydrolase